MKSILILSLIVISCAKYDDNEMKKMFVENKIDFISVKDLILNSQNNITVFTNRDSIFEIQATMNNSQSKYVELSRNNDFKPMSEQEDLSEFNLSSEQILLIRSFMIKNDILSIEYNYNFSFIIRNDWRSDYTFSYKVEENNLPLLFEQEDYTLELGDNWFLTKGSK